MPQVTSKHLQGIAELTLVAPIKQGFVDSLDTWTYATRLRLVMQALNVSRGVTREQSLFRPFSDAVERIQGIHSFRLAVLEPDRLLLAVHFDGGWEPYIRRIWWDLGPLLDLIFCNCEGYKSAFDHGFDEYTAWLRGAQIDSGFFYVASGLTVTDFQYLRQAERLRREGGHLATNDMDAAQLVAADPGQLALDAASGNLALTASAAATGLGALYRLAHMYPIDSPLADGRYLLRAAHELLKELRTIGADKVFAAAPVLANALKAQIEWFKQPAPRPAPRPERLQFKSELVQGGVVKSYDELQPGKPMTHGCLLLFQITDAAEARAFLGGLKVSRDGELQPDGSSYVNVALTVQGLQRLGVPTAEIEKFPKEFREGMEARAGLLGDFRSNHPVSWALPPRNWPAGASGQVQLGSVDIVVQLRTRAARVASDHEIAGNTAHPLHPEVERLSGISGVRLLSVEAMLRVGPEQGNPTGHIGFADGISQPRPQDVVADPVAGKWNDDVRWGEILCGYGNDRGDGPIKAADGAYLDNGTFLVVRKLKLDIQALNAFAADQAPKLALSPDELKAKMMGRSPDGAPLAEPANKDNTFTYDGDRDGARCPFQAHARRANPRTGAEKPRVPRLMRRGMSYGPEMKDQPGAARGLMFLAYNASIAEQFEVIQRWIAGGNASGVFSGESDPFLGVPQPGDPRCFRFQHGGEVRRAELDRGAPFARLEWGIYLFVPSLPVLEKIAYPDPAQPPGTAKGEEIIAYLRSISDPVRQAGAWKGYLEDFLAKESGANLAVWAAIRAKHGGVLKTPYGILVASSALADEVLKTRKERYSVYGYRQRMEASIGENYLGLDDDGPQSQYRRESAQTNAELMSMDLRTAFTTARAVTDGVFVQILQQLPNRQGPVDLRTSVSDNVLGLLSKAWFDLPDGSHVKPGGWSWDPARPAPVCPGDFTSPSRCIFSPHPGDKVQDYARQHGEMLRLAVKEFVLAMRQRPDDLKGRFSRAMFRDIADDDRLVRTLIGTMMGFLPTVDGNFRSTLHEWLTDKSLWRRQSDLMSSTAADPYQRAKAALLLPLMRTMQKRPVPDMIWRTARTVHQLGAVPVQAGDRIVIGIVSATQEALGEGRTDVYPVFGGERAGNHPTHACPAYEVGMGVLLGMISGVLEAGALRPTPSPLTVFLIGK